MRYNEAYDYINSFTNYEKTPGIKRDLNEDGLARTRHLIALLGDPHESFRSIVVAGTKGKGSVCAMLDSVLREGGYKVGLFTSPHLHTFRERIRVNGEMIPPADVARLVERIQPVVAQIQAGGDLSNVPTTYELATAIAFLYFQEAAIDLAVLEVGLGGRLDAVNITTPLVSVITSISLDHTEVLGNTIEEIAYEKSGIIKQGVNVVTSPQTQQAMAIINYIANHRKANLKVVGREVFLSSGNLPEVRLDEHGVPTNQTFTIAYEEGPDEPQTKLRVKLPLMGNHQQINAAVVIATLLELRKAGVNTKPEAVLSGLAHVHWPGRLEVVRRDPLVIVDGAHNADSMSKLNQAMHDLVYKQPLIVVFGSLRDKDITGMVNELGSSTANVFGPQVKKLIVTRPDYVRAADPKTAAEAAQARGIDVEVIEDLPSALAKAEALAVEGPNAPAPVVLVTGSLYIVAEAREYYGLAPDLSEEEG
ncbi:MAG: folylpolyglutamate synthase/dihydrofolate synthase family protein [Chloroflexia bacterium]